MMRHLVLLVLLSTFSSFQLTSAWTTFFPITENRGALHSEFFPGSIIGAKSCLRVFQERAKKSFLRMALDYNDPVVAEEFGKVQTMEFEEVEEELLESGIPVSAAINDMDAKLMLVEVRLRKSGRMPGKAKAVAKTTFSSEYEKQYETNAVFKDLIDQMKKRDDINSVNVAMEYVNSKEIALKRYGESYKPTIRQIERALTAPPPVKSKILKFSGFPANMGEMGCKMTLEALGDVISFECEESEDFPILVGKVEFEDLDSAKKAVEQYNGMDMGMGTKLEIMSV